jgi:hypothetical protein
VVRVEAPSKVGDCDDKRGGDQPKRDDTHRRSVHGEPPSRIGQSPGVARHEDRRGYDKHGGECSADDVRDEQTVELVIGVSSAMVMAPNETCCWKLALEEDDLGFVFP